MLAQGIMDWILYMQEIKQCITHVVLVGGRFMRRDIHQWFHRQNHQTLLLVLMSLAGLIRLGKHVLKLQTLSMVMKHMLLIQIGVTMHWRQGKNMTIKIFLKHVAHVEGLFMRLASQVQSRHLNHLPQHPLLFLWCHLYRLL